MRKHRATVTFAGIIALAALPFIGSGCAMLAQREIARAQDAYGVKMQMSSSAVAADLAGGNSFVLARNTSKELAAFPYRATEGLTIHIGTGIDLLRQARSLEDVLAAPFTIAGVQDRPGDTLGDIYITNKDVWMTYIDLLQPNTVGWQDPHLRHEIMHAIEIAALRERLFSGDPATRLNEKVAFLDKLRHIDGIALGAGDDEMVAGKRRPYVDFCARYLACSFADVNDDGRLDDEDVSVLRRDPSRFDADRDGEITYEDARVLTKYGYSFASGISPLVQMEMAAGLLGQRPKGFASAYGRTCPWEDKATVLEYAVQQGLLPALFRDVGKRNVEKAYERLETTRERDPVLARKIEIHAIFFGNLEYPERRNAAFAERYGALMRSLSR